MTSFSNLVSQPFLCINICVQNKSFLSLIHLTRMDPQDFVNAKHFLLKMASLSLLFFWQNSRSDPVEPKEFSGIMGTGTHIVFCCKVNIQKTDINSAWEDSMALSSYTKALFSHSKALDINCFCRMQDNLQLQNTQTVVLNHLRVCSPLKKFPEGYALFPIQSTQAHIKVVCDFRMFTSP